MITQDQHTEMRRLEVSTKAAYRYWLKVWDKSGVSTRSTTIKMTDSAALQESDRARTAWGKAQDEEMAFRTKMLSGELDDESGRPDLDL